ncbi:hypothetical protein D6C80_07907 [Aureobasidium pullulans]|nr:hypothetical protein D6C80_07907 [Aureobasidium pullulans]
MHTAAAGGTTTIITFATQTRDEEDRSLIKVVEAYNARAEATGSYIDYGFHVIIVRNDPEILEHELPVLVRDWGVTSCKLFMTYESQRLTDTQLLDVMLASQRNEITTVYDLQNRNEYGLTRHQMIHAENGDMIQWLTEKLEDKGMVAPYYHALSRPPIVEMEATNRAIALAGLIENPVLFVHIGSPLAATNVRNAQTQGMPIYAETCPQYLNLTYDDLACEGEALQNLVSRKPGSFRFIPNGIPGVETRISLLYTGGLATGRITPQKFVELTSTNPSKLYATEEEANWR